MSEVVRNLVWLLPSPREDEDVSRLLKIAADAGMAVEDWRGERSGRPAPSDTCFVIVDHPAAVAESDPHRWIIVQSSDLTDAVTTLNARHPEWAHHDTVTNLSTWLAFANYLTLHGAAPVDDISHVLDMHNGATPSVGHTSDVKERHPLSLYSTLPVAPSASAEWQPCDFYYTKGSQRTGGTPDIDLTGGGRILVYGPNIALTPGNWHVEAEFDLDSEGETVDLRFDWGPAEEATTSICKLSLTGRYRIELSHTWLQNQTAEFRIWIQHGMLHGALRFHGAKIRRLG